MSDHKKYLLSRHLGGLFFGCKTDGISGIGGCFMRTGLCMKRHSYTYSPDRSFVFDIYIYIYIYTTLAKKRTIFEIRGEKNAVPRVISCSITRDQRRAKVADSRGSDLALR